MCQPIDKQKVFFENISPNTTTDSLKAYLLEKYQIQSCTVPSESGKNKGHGIVVFFDEAEVDTLMENRPHIIDGAQVEIYRSVLNQGALKKKKGVKNLIVSGIKNKLTESHLKKYFKNYGKINYIDMNNQDNFCRIEFDE
jgi:RNA recognition motif-containing protein